MNWREYITVNPQILKEYLKNFIFSIDKEIENH
jgi:hypothetical protein